MRRNSFEQIRRAEARFGHRIPESVVAAGPDDPHVAAFDLIGAELHGAVHVAEEIFIGRRETRGVTPHPHRSSLTRPGRLKTRGQPANKMNANSRGKTDRILFTEDVLFR